MRRTLLIAALTTGLLALTPGTASAAPPGEGLMELFPVHCEELGTVLVVEPRGEPPTAWLDGNHVVVKTFLVSAPDGTVLFFRAFGNKAGLATQTCEDELEEDGFVVHAEAQVAVVPPR